jgi:hypothetical protein
MNLGARETEVEKMVYTIDECQLLQVWSAMRSFSQLREVNDPVAQNEILTNAQIVLTAFLLNLKPLVRGQPALPR